MKASLSVASVIVVIGLTIVAATYRVSTAPERVRSRLNTAKESCTAGGGEWVKVGTEEECRPPADRKG